LKYIEQYGRWYCHTCQKYAPAQPTQQAQTSADKAIWFQNFYRVRKKVIAIANQYWIEDAQSKILGFSKQKLFKWKEDIRIYTDESMTRELFKIQQTQIIDTWGKFAVMDSNTNTILGYLKRSIVSEFVVDEWDVLDANGQLIGGVHEKAGRGLARRFLPGGSLIPEKMKLELNGVPVAEIDQQFKIIGDIWEMKCLNVPNYIDRRVLIAGLILMAMIERSRK